MLKHNIINFINNRQGYLLQALMVFILIGSICYCFLSNEYKEPMETQIQNLSNNVGKWTVGGVD